MSSTALPTSLPTITLLIDNMHCTSCCENIHHLLSAVPSIKSISTSLLLHSVAFAVDIDSHESTSTSRRPKTIGKIVKEASKILRSEGGFNVIAESANGYSLNPNSTFRKLTARNEREEDDIGWIGKFFFKGKEEGKRRKLELRRNKHLEHCKICQEELHNSQGQIDEAQSSEGISKSSTEKDKFPGEKGEDTIFKTTFSIEGMTCASCVNSISSTLKSNPSLISVNINLLGSSGTVRHISSITVEEMVRLIEDTGFEAIVIKSEPEPKSPTSIEESGTKIQSFKSTFSIEGMTCASCSGAITRSLQGHPGIQDVNIDLLNNAGTIVHSSDISVEEIKELVGEVGYDAELSSSHPVHTSSKGKEKDERPQIRTVQIHVEGMFCHDCVRKVNSYLDTLPIETYTPITLNSPITTISYIPYKPLTIRNLLEGVSSVAPEFEAEILRTQSLSERSKGIQKREVKVLASHCLVAIVFAIPTFIVAIVAMILLPGHNKVKMEMMKPIWGAANLGTIILWPLATIVQFGVGRIFYKRTFASMWPHLRRLVPLALRTQNMRRLPPKSLSWRTLISFGSMDLLVVLSTTVSYFASLAMLILDVRSPPQTESVGTYFDSCVFLIMFILLGRTLEAYAKSKTTDAVSLLGKMRPDTAFLVEGISPESPEDLERAEKKESAGDSASSSDHSSHLASTQTTPRKIPVEHLEIGDVLLLQPGSLPPTDGVIVSGHTTFDESSLTGESRPISKTINDQVFTGTINLTSAITMRVTDLEENTMIEKIIRAVSDASSRKAPLELLAEKLTGYFVPVIVYFSLLVLLVWLSLSLTNTVHLNAGRSGGKVFFALEFAIATLVVACPCGIGLAIPCANAVGNGLTAKKGILSSGGGQAFLAVTKIKKIVFDKTGTLTLGKSVVIDDEWLVEDQDRRNLIKEAIEVVERGSTHPLAIGLVEHLEKDKHGRENEGEHRTEVLETSEVAGRGLKASVKINGQIVNLLIGNAALLSDHAVTFDLNHQQSINKWSNDAKSVILIASSITSQNTQNETQELSPDYKIAAMFSLSDPPRESSIPLIKSLKEKGIEVSMLSGDNEFTALAVGKLIGLDENQIKGGVGPEGKAEVIRDMQKELRERDGKNGLVMFVGDGLNDSVALAAADVSCAMGHGSQATLASADFVLLSSSLDSITDLIQISKKIILRQKINLLWALLFNVVCLPFAAGFFYGLNGIRLNPIWSAILMALSSLSVVASSLAMRWGL